jgi:hypothetical protein
VEIQRQRENRSRWGSRADLVGRVQLVVRERQRRRACRFHVQVRRRRERERGGELFEREKWDGFVRATELEHWVEPNRMEEDEEELVVVVGFPVVVGGVIRRKLRDGLGHHGGE